MSIRQVAFHAENIAAIKELRVFSIFHIVALDIYLYGQAQSNKADEPDCMAPPMPHASGMRRGLQQVIRDVSR